MKFYFETADSEMCYTLAYFKAKGLPEMELYEAIRTTDDGAGWCKELERIIEKGDCGRFCESYSPKNGKSGMCLHKSNRMFEHGKKVTIKF